MSEKKIIQKTEYNGFKVTSYIEDLTEKDRQDRDNQLAQATIKILHNYYEKIIYK